MTTGTEYVEAWRVDDYRMTLEKTEVYPNTPLGKWFYAALGTGMYSYYETREEAEEVFIAVAKAKIDKLQFMINNVKEI